ncbi:hypothetical protein D3C84_938220 [compost metagenome]
MTVMPAGPSWSESVLVMWAMARLRMPERTLLPRPVRPPILMMRPKPPAFMCGVTALAQRK